MNKRRAKAEAYRLIAADIEVLKDTLDNKYTPEDAEAVAESLDHQRRVFLSRLYRLGYDPEPEYTADDAEKWSRVFHQRRD